MADEELKTTLARLTDLIELERSENVRFRGEVRERLAGTDKRLDGIEGRLNGIDRRLDGIETGLREFKIDANGAGKSTLLQALAFLPDFVKGRPSSFFDRRQWSAKDICSRFSVRPGSC